MWLIGLRVEETGELQVGSVLGALREVFAVVIYRHAAGLRWVHQMATTGGQTDSEATSEGMDCLKVEWTAKRELAKPDLEVLAAGGFKPPGRGRVWPRFQSWQPGWYPWVVNEAEARQFTEHLGKVARLVRLLERVPHLFQNHRVGEVPVVPGGDEHSLRAEDLEWLPLVPEPAPPPEPVVLSADEEAGLAKLPLREHLVFELIAPMMPELSFLDETARRPCCARPALMVDSATAYILWTELGHGAAPLREPVRSALVKGLRAAQARPGAIHVNNERLAAVLRPACEAIGVRVELVPHMKGADEVLSALARFSRMR